MKKSILNVVMIIFFTVLLIFILTGCEIKKEVKEENINQNQNTEEIANNQNLNNDIEKTKENGNENKSNSENIIGDNEIITNENKTDNNIAKKNEELKNIYFEVLDGKRKYINKENVEEGIEKYLKEASQNGETKITYTILDMDDDKEDELIALLNGEYYLILNYEDGKVYGFRNVLRGMLNIKTDGYYFGSGGAATGGVMRSTFEKNKIKTEILAYRDIDSNSNQIFQIGERNVTEKEYLNFYKTEFEEKQNAKFIKYEKTNKNSNQAEEQTENNSVSVDGEYVYTVPMNGIENEGSKQTLKLKDGTAELKDSYFGNEKTGTYTVKDNKISVVYTKEKSFNQGANKWENNTISVKAEYTISGKNLINTGKTFIKK